VSDDFHANNDAAISKLEDRVRELETRHETLTAKLPKPTEETILAGALAAGLDHRRRRTMSPGKWHQVTAARRRIASDD
jgi:hypothetical protein